MRGGGGRPPPRALPLDPPLEWYRTLTQLVSCSSEKKSGKASRKIEIKKETKKQKPKHGEDCALFFGLWKKLKAYNFNSGLFVSLIHLLSPFSCKAGVIIESI